MMLKVRIVQGGGRDPRFVDCHASTDHRSDLWKPQRGKEQKSSIFAHILQRFCLIGCIAAFFRIFAPCGIGRMTLDIKDNPKSGHEFSILFSILHKWNKWIKLRQGSHCSIYVEIFWADRYKGAL